MNQDNWTRLKEIISILLEIEITKVSQETGPETVEQWDSLNHINICTAVNQEFGVSMTTEEMNGIRNVADLAKLLGAKGICIQ